MDAWSYVLYVLAVAAATETWSYGSIFSNIHAKIEVYETWWAELLTCNFCLSHWLAALLVAIHYCTLPTSWDGLLLAPVY